LKVAAGRKRVTGEGASTVLRSLDEVLQKAKQFPTRRVAVAVAEERSVLEALAAADRERLAYPILVGDRAKIEALCAEVGLAPDRCQIQHQPSDVKAAQDAAVLVRCGQADLLMKGHLHSDDFLRAVLDKETGLRMGVLMSHVFILELREENRLVFLTDCAMNVAPDLVQKAQIVLNAVYLAHLFGYAKPTVAVLAAVELVNPGMPATVEAAVLAKMSERRQFPDCIIDGPFALDNAVSLAAAQTKGLGGPVAGRADILLVPDIEAGNILAKSFAHLAKGRLVGVVVGARAPIILTSRADSAEAKMLSIATASLMCSLERTQRLKIGKVHY